MRIPRPVPLVLGVSALVLAAVLQVGAPPAAAGSSGDDVRRVDEGDPLVAEGHELYLTGCSSCHGAEGGGVITPEGELRGPSLRHSGAAGAFYYLSTGRMPLPDPDNQPSRKDPAYTPDEIAALVAFVASLGDGPEVPDVDIEDADLAVGGVLYRGNCQACHSAFGSGGALSYGFSAPNLYDATPTEIGAALRAGPGLMPVFGEPVVDDEELEDLAAYVVYLRTPANPGGLQVGRNGPVPEGFVAWLFGIGALLVVVAWVGGVTTQRSEREPEDHG
jgi:ubiquinol-cytochrome c reductase cytochrome c subunit